MNILHAIIIAIVEGITEFLPVSSTGHMILTERLLGLQESDFDKLFIVDIQFGAILSVVVLYWKKFFKSLKFYYKLFIAFIPAAVLGFLLDDYIDMLLGSVMVVAISLLIGGVFLIFVDKLFINNQLEPDCEVQDISFRRAFIIGLFQVIAMIPGVSRSAATIVGGLTQKLSRQRAAEFSFFLAVPTMLAASAYKMLSFVTKSGYQILIDNAHILLIGNIVAFVVALIAIKTFINILNKYGFKFFGYYRILLGITIIILLTLHENFFL